MRALLFEVLPRPDHEGHYFDRAVELKPVLERHAGLLFLDRYRSQSRPGLILSHSLWRDEEALVAWRRDPAHKQAQAAGRNQHFADYRIRISTVLHHVRSDSTAARPWPDMPGNGPSDEGASRLIIVSSRGVSYKGEGEVFASINDPGSYLTVFDVATETQGKQAVLEATALECVTDVKYCLVCRDYGMFERAQAPREFLSQTAESR